MKRKLPLVCLLVGLVAGAAATSQAQVNEEWFNDYNGSGNYVDNAFDIVVDDLGNSYVTGHVWNGLDQDDYATVKYDSVGTQMWAQEYDGPVNGRDRAYAIAVDGSGNVLVTGNSDGDGTGADIVTIKYDSLGNLLWTQRYNGSGNGPDGAGSIVIDQFDNVYVAGSSHESGNSDYILLKYAPDSTLLWHRTLDGAGNLSDHVADLAVDAGGFAYITGNSTAAIGNNDYLTIKYDPNGTLMWSAAYNGDGDGNDYAAALDLDADGNVYITGRSLGTTITADDIATIKYNNAGQQLWVARYSGPGGGPGNSPDAGADIAVDNGDVYVTGYSMTSTRFDYVTIKYDVTGNQAWVRLYDGPYLSGSQNDRAKALVVDTAGNVTVTGQSQGFSFSQSVDNIFTIQYDPLGYERWQQTYSGPLTAANIFHSGGNAIAVDTSDNIYVTGAAASSGTGGVSDMTTIKYSQNQPPVASAGPDQLVYATSPAGALVSLDGSGSSDPNEVTLSYEWSGPFGTVSGVTADVSLAIGIHAITLTVTDSHGATDGDAVSITVDVPDTDGDGIADYADLCPTEDATGFDSDEDGCIDSVAGAINLVDNLVQEGVIAPEMSNSLTHQFENADSKASRDNICAAVNGLGGLFNAIEAQTGKKISEGAADELAAYIKSLISYYLNLLAEGESC